MGECWWKCGWLVRCWGRIVCLLCVVVWLLFVLVVVVLLGVLCFVDEWSYRCCRMVWLFVFGCLFFWILVGIVGYLVLVWLVMIGGCWLNYWWWWWSLDCCCICWCVFWFMLGCVWCWWCDLVRCCVGCVGSWLLCRFSLVWWGGLLVDVFVCVCFWWFMYCWGFEIVWVLFWLDLDWDVVRYWGGWFCCICCSWCCYCVCNCGRFVVCVVVWGFWWYYCWLGGVIDWLRWCGDWVLGCCLMWWWVGYWFDGLCDWGLVVLVLRRLLLVRRLFVLVGLGVGLLILVCWVGLLVLVMEIW